METLHLREFEKVAVNVESLLRNGRLDIYPEVEKDLFEVRLSSRDTFIQARGWIGTIPVNDSLTLHVTPRVTVTNLNRLIEISECSYKHLTRSLRSYEQSGEMYPALISIYTAALTDGIGSIAQQGLLKEYERRTEVTSTPHGRVLVGPTIQFQEGRNQHHRAVTTWFQRSADTAVNRCLLFAVYRLSAYNQRFCDSLPHAEYRRNASSLNHAAQLLGGVTLDLSHRFLSDPILQGVRPLPTVRDYYRPTLDLAMTIVAGRAIVVDQDGGQLQLPSLLINMSDVFEAFLRNVLRRAAQQEAWPTRVLDGNRPPGQKLLLDEGAQILVQPDVVLRSRSEKSPIHPVVIEVRYKPARQLPQRNDLEQTLTSGFSYRASNVVIVALPVSVGSE
jgi:5-methylcytosine-specific restriction enzyme subunit McrC